MAPKLPNPEKTPQQRFFDWTELAAPRETLAARRAALAEALTLTGNGVLLVPAADGHSHGGTFRQLNNFLYLSGLELPNSVLAIDSSDGKATLFAPRFDERFQSASRPNDFPGRALAADSRIAEVSGIEIRPIEELDVAVANWFSRGRTFFVDLARASAKEIRPSDWVFTWNPGEALVHHLHTLYPSAKVQNAYELIAHSRMVKSREEVAILRRSCALNADAIVHAAGFIRPGVDERGLEAELEAYYKRGGSQRLAFDSIIKSGPNSLWPWRILATHYDRRNRRMKSGELVIFDVGCELDHYSSDAGRTFPVSGRFTDRQRELVRMATKVSDGIIAAVRPGVTFAELQETAVALIPEEERRFMQTGLFFGHHIGLNVGDPRVADRPLEAGMVFTVEPWYYNHEEDIAVFIEDDVLVTETGSENLTASLPRSPAELEQLVQGE